MPRTPDTSTVRATYRRLVPPSVRRRIAKRISPKLRARLSSPTPPPRSEVRVLHASVDGGDTLNIAVSAAADWADPVLVLQCAEQEIELPTRTSTDLGGTRRAESSVRIGTALDQDSALPVIVADPGSWRIELRDRVGPGSVPLIHDRQRDPANPRGASWSINGAVGDALVLEATPVQPYPRVETIAIGLTTIKVAGTLVGPWVPPLTVLMRLRGSELELDAPATCEGGRFRALLPLDDMIENDGVWECHLRVGHKTRRAVTRPSGSTDRRFDIETPVRLVAASDGRLVRVRGYTTKSGGFSLSTTANVEESS